MIVWKCCSTNKTIFYHCCENWHHVQNLCSVPLLVFYTCVWSLADFLKNDWKKFTGSQFGHNAFISHKKYLKTNDCSCFLAISDKWPKHLRKKVIHPHINLLKTKRKAANSKPNHCSTDDGWLLNNFSFFRHFKDFKYKLLNHKLKAFLLEIAMQQLQLYCCSETMFLQIILQCKNNCISTFFISCNTTTLLLKLTSECFNKISV